MLDHDLCDRYLGMGLNRESATTLASSPSLAGYFDIVSQDRKPDVVAACILADCFIAIRNVHSGFTFEDLSDFESRLIPPETLGQFIDFSAEYPVSEKIRTRILERMIATGKGLSESIAELGIELPETKSIRRARYIALGLNNVEAETLACNLEMAAYFDAVVPGRDPRMLASWIMIELSTRLNKLLLNFETSPVSPVAFGELLDLVAAKFVSGNKGKDVLEKMLETGLGAVAVATQMGLSLPITADVTLLFVRDVLAANADKVVQYKSGDRSLFTFFVKATLKAMGPNARIELVNQILRKQLA